VPTLPPDALVLSGTLGAGKTAIAEAVSDALALDVPDALLDLDALAQTKPRPAEDPYNDDLVFANLAAIWPNYTARGVRRAVIARVVSDSHRDRYIAALKTQRIAIVRLIAPSELRKQRLRARELDPVWSAYFCRRTDALAQALEHVPVDFVLDNVRAPADVAADVLHLVHWPTCDPPRATP